MRNWVQENTGRLGKTTRSRIQGLIGSTPEGISYLQQQHEVKFKILKS